MVFAEKKKLERLNSILSKGFGGKGEGHSGLLEKKKKERTFSLSHRVDDNLTMAFTINKTVTANPDELLQQMIEKKGEELQSLNF
jgi:hypothetical protein